MEVSLKELVENFSGNPIEASRARREIVDLLKDDRMRFSRDVVHLLKSVSDSGGYQYLFRFLLDQGLLYNLLSDPSHFTLEQSVAIGRSLQKMDPQADVKLARLLVETNTDSGLDAFAEERVLEVSTAVSSGIRLLPILVQLLKSPNQRIRSKAALLVGRMTASARPVEGALAESDARVRANAVESLWGIRSPEAEAAFRSAIAAADNRTAGNGLVGLYLLGQLESIGLLLDRAGHADPALRATVAWAMGATGDPRFVPALKSMLADGDGAIRRNVLTALTRIRRSAERRMGGEKLDISFAQCRVESGLARVRLVVAGPANEEAPALVPTCFILWHCESPVARFEVVERFAASALTVGFGSAGLDRPADPFHAAYREAFGKCLAFARDGDRWFLAERLPSRGPSSPTARPQELVNAFQADKLASSPCEDLFAAARRALTAIADARGSRQVILLGQASAAPAASTPSELRELARRARATVHAVTLRPSPEMESLCVDTGGAFLCVGAPDELPAAAEHVYVSLLHHYELKFPATEPAGGEIRVQVFSEQGYGEASHSVVNTSYES